MSTTNLQVAVADTMAVPASTLALVTNGAQNAIVGNEIVGVVDATDQGGGSYAIGPTLVRGMRGSPQTGHVAGEPFAAAPSVASTTKVQVPKEWIGRTVYVRVLSPGQDLDDSPEIAVLIAAPTPPYVSHLPVWTADSFSGDGSTKAFALAQTPVSGSLTVTVAGSTLDPSAYSISGTALTLATAPASGAAISARYQY